MNNNTKFLELYKELESLIKESYKDALQVSNLYPVNYYETEILKDNVLEQEKLRMCRILRNYLQHNDDGNKFILISDAQIKFLEDLIFSIKSINLQVKDLYMTIKKGPFINITAHMNEAADLMTKLSTDTLYVYKEKQDLIEIVGSITTKDLLKTLSKGATSKTQIKTFVNSEKNNFSTVDINDLIMNLEKKPYIVLKKNKIVGFIQIF